MKNSFCLPCLLKQIQSIFIYTHHTLNFEDLEKEKNVKNDFKD